VICSSWIWVTAVTLIGVSVGSGVGSVVGTAVGSSGVSPTSSGVTVAVGSTGSGVSGHIEGVDVAAIGGVTAGVGDTSWAQPTSVKLIENMNKTTAFRIKYPLITNRHSKLCKHG
jgi:hypothetical protein